MSKVFHQKLQSAPKNKNVGADDIHPLAMAAMQRKKSQSASWSGTNGVGAWMEQKSKEKNKTIIISSSEIEGGEAIANKATEDSPLMNNTQIVYNKEEENSPVVSELTPPTPPLATNNQIGTTSSSATSTAAMKNKSSDNNVGR